MKLLIVLVTVASACFAAPSGLVGLHGVGLVGPVLGVADISGPVVGPAAVSGPVTGGAHISGAVAGPALITGSVAGPSAVIGSVAGPTLMFEPSLGAVVVGNALGYGGVTVAHANVDAAALVGAAAGATVVAGPDGGVISSNGVGHGAVLTDAHGHW